MVQLEMTMANMESEMEHQRRMYESKLKLLEEKIKQAENDRDLAIKQSQNKDDTSNPKVFIIVARISNGYFSIYFRIMQYHG